MISGDESFEETATDLRVSSGFDAGFDAGFDESLYDSRVSADFDAGFAAGFALISPVSGTTASTELG